MKFCFRVWLLRVVFGCGRFGCLCWRITPVKPPIDGFGVDPRPVAVVVAVSWFRSLPLPDT